MMLSGSDLDFIRPGISLFGAPPSEYKNPNFIDLHLWEI